MTKFKKVLLASTATVMTVALAIGGTMAYLTSQDSDVNVMTLGNVEIEQIEQERDENGELVDFTQAKPLYPAVGTIAWNDEKININGHDYSMFGEKLKNSVDKIVTVKNTGKSDAYVRTWIALEDPFTTNMLGVNVGGVGYTQSSWTAAEIDGVKYSVTCFTYDEALESGEVSLPSLLQVYLKSIATNDDVAILGDAYEILAFSQAVQTNGFADAKTALETAFGTNHPWVDGVDVPVVVSDADGLVEALANDEDVVLTKDVKINPANMSNAYGTTGINVKNGQTIDGAGHTLDIKGAGGTWDSGINTTGGLIKDITVTGSFRGIFINHNSTHSERVILKNVVIKGTTYTISCDQGTNQGLTATNSTFNGWTSYAKTLGDAEFIDCSFGAGNGYSYCRPYAPTTFVGCDFEAGYQMDPVAAVTFENCTIGGVALTASNLSTLVTSNIKNATVK